MSVLDDVRAEFNVHTNMCQACVWLATQSTEDQADWGAVMIDRTVPHAAIFRAMRKRGFTRNSGSVEGHRNNMHGQEA